MTKSLQPGVYAASLTWFSPGEAQEINEHLQSLHLRYLIHSGLTGLVLAGSNGEAVALTAEERLRLIVMTRRLASDLGRGEMPIIIGTVGQTNKDIIAQLHASHAAGADFGLVLTPDYFHFAMDSSSILDFFISVADSSPIPIIIYSWPLVTSGIEISSDMISSLGKHPNIVGIKLTCGSIGKTVRVASEFEKEQFSAFSGHSDWLVPNLSCGGAGCISGLANICPKACVVMYQNYVDGNLESAKKIQYEVAKAEWALVKAGINGTKWTAATLLGYGPSCCETRRPYPKFLNQTLQQETLAAFKALNILERSF